MGLLERLFRVKPCQPDVSQEVKALRDMVDDIKTAFDDQQKQINRLERYYYRNRGNNQTENTEDLSWLDK